MTRLQQGGHRLPFVRHLSKPLASQVVAAAVSETASVSSFVPQAGRAFVGQISIFQHAKVRIDVATLSSASSRENDKLFNGTITSS
jgi:hypothetical protein